MQSDHEQFCRMGTQFIELLPKPFNIQPKVIDLESDSSMKNIANHDKKKHQVMIFKFNLMNKEIISRPPVTCFTNHIDVF